MKKLVSLLVMVVMCMTLAVPAFAAEPAIVHDADNACEEHSHEAGVLRYDACPVGPGSCQWQQVIVQSIEIINGVPTVVLEPNMMCRLCNRFWN